MAQCNQAVTIKHAARDAGVSLQTVSRVMNSAPNVSPEMKQRVQASIDRLGYVPSIVAQRMGGRRGAHSRSRLEIAGAPCKYDMITFTRCDRVRNCELRHEKTRPG
jgi:hypothetical protein